LAQEFVFYVQNNDESTEHIFLSCTFSQQIWNDMEDHLGLSNLWNKESLEGCFSVWFGKKELKPLKAIMYLTLWGIWLAHNLIMFEGKFVPAFKVFS
jgi:hypothetical protein